MPDYQKPLPHELKDSNAYWERMNEYEKLHPRPKSTESEQLWPTPTSRDYKDGTAESCANVEANGLLGRVVHLRPTTRTTEMFRTPLGTDGSKQGHGNLAHQVKMGGDTDLSRSHGERTGNPGARRTEVGAGEPGTDVANDDCVHGDSSRPEEAEARTADLPLAGDRHVTDTESLAAWELSLGAATEQPGFAGGRWWITEPNVGRVVHGVSARVDRLKGLGNAVVPQIPYLIGQAINEVEKGEE